MKKVEVVRLEARTDFRLEKLASALVYYARGCRKRRPRSTASFLALTGKARGEPVQVELLGRHLDVPQAIDGVARFDFDSLCRRPLGSADYLVLAERFHTLIVDDIPVLTPAERNEAKRSIILVDALYDARVKLIARTRMEDLSEVLLPSFSMAISTLWSLPSWSRRVFHWMTYILLMKSLITVRRLVDVVDVRRRPVACRQCAARSSPASAASPDPARSGRWRGWGCAACSRR